MKPSPFRDVYRGLGGNAGGQFVKDSSQGALKYNFALLQESGIPLTQENDQFIYLRDD